MEETGGSAFVPTPVIRMDVGLDKRSVSQTQTHVGKKGKSKKAGTSGNTTKQKTPKRFTCAVTSCNYSGVYAKDLVRHMRKHTGEKPYQCEFCDTCFSRRDKLVLHRRSHVGVRSYPCQQCDYSAVNPYGLRKHMRIHADERPYKCQLCPYAAKESSNLVIHLRTHTGDTPYKCQQSGCSAGFKTLSDLTRHNRKHSGLKPYHCNECEYKAAVKSNLNAHIKRHHKTVGRDKPSNEGIELEQRNKGMSLSTSGIEQPLIQQEEEPQPPTETVSRVTSVIQVDHTHKETIIRAQPTESPEQFSVTNDELPFDFACKICEYRSSSYHVFSNHMESSHAGVQLKSVNLDSLMRTSKHVVSQPPKKRKTRGNFLNGEIETYFECQYCSASFVREDSLRCHMRQHPEDNNITPFQQMSMGHQQVIVTTIVPTPLVYQRPPEQTVIRTAPSSSVSASRIVENSDYTSNVVSDSFQYLSDIEPYETHNDHSEWSQDSNLQTL